MMFGVSLSLLLENSITAIIIVIYLGYSMRWGKLGSIRRRIEGLADAVMALAIEHENIDEKSVAERVNGNMPSLLITNQTEDEKEEEEVETRQ